MDFGRILEPFWVRFGPKMRFKSDFEWKRFEDSSLKRLETGLKRLKAAKRESRMCGAGLNGGPAQPTHPGAM